MRKLSQVCEILTQIKKPYNATVIGVISDMSRAVFRKKQGNYMMQLNVIDDTMHDGCVFGIMNRNASVYLVSKDKEQISNIGRIGDIIILRKFTFMLWNSIKLQTKYTGGIEGLYIVKYDTLTIHNKLGIECENSLKQIDKIYMEMVYKLKNWFHSGQNRIYKPQLGLTPLSKICIMIEPFNMILRVVNYNLHGLTLTDGNQNTYYLRNSQQKISQPAIKPIKPNDYVIVRQIKQIDKNYQLKLTETGCANVLPSTIQYASLMNYVSVYWQEDKTAINKTKSSQSNNLTLLLQREDSLRVAFLYELSQLQMKYDSSIRKEEMTFPPIYQINVAVLNWYGQLKMYHCQYQMILHNEFLQDLSLEERKDTLQNKKIIYVFEGRIGLMDRSNENNNKVFYIEVFNSDAKGLFFQPKLAQQLNQLVGTQNQYLAKKRLQSHIKGLLDSLVQNSSFSNPASFLVQCIRSDRLIYRLVNTIITPPNYL